MNPEDEDHWWERTESDPDLAEAVWAGEVSEGAAPSWYPAFVHLLDAAGSPGPSSKAELARTGEAWIEVQREARRRKRRRRMLVAKAVAVGAAIAAGATAAAAATDGQVLPLVQWEAKYGAAAVDAGVVEVPPAPEPDGVNSENRPDEAKPRCPEKRAPENGAHEAEHGSGRSCGKARPNDSSGKGSTTDDRPGKADPKHPRPTGK